MAIIKIKSSYLDSELSNSQFQTFDDAWRSICWGGVNQGDIDPIFEIQDSEEYSLTISSYSFGSYLNNIKNSITITSIVESAQEFPVVRISPGGENDIAPTFNLSKVHFKPYGLQFSPTFTLNKCNSLNVDRAIFSDFTKAIFSANLFRENSVNISRSIFDNNTLYIIESTSTDSSLTVSSNNAITITGSTFYYSNVIGGPVLYRTACTRLLAQDIDVFPKIENCIIWGFSDVIGVGALVAPTFTTAYQENLNVNNCYIETAVGIGSFNTTNRIKATDPFTSATATNTVLDYQLIEYSGDITDTAFDIGGDEYTDISGTTSGGVTYAGAWSPQAVGTSVNNPPVIDTDAVVYLHPDDVPTKINPGDGSGDYPFVTIHDDEDGYISYSSVTETIPTELTAPSPDDGTYTITYEVKDSRYYTTTFTQSVVVYSDAQINFLPTNSFDTLSFFQYQQFKDDAVQLTSSGGDNEIITYSSFDNTIQEGLGSGDVATNQITLDSSFVIRPNIAISIVNITDADFEIDGMSPPIGNVYYVNSVSDYVIELAYTPGGTSLAITAPTSGTFDIVYYTSNILNDSQVLASNIEPAAFSGLNLTLSNVPRVGSDFATDTPIFFSKPNGLKIDGYTVFPGDVFYAVGSVATGIIQVKRDRSGGTLTFDASGISDETVEVCVANIVYEEFDPQFMNIPDVSGDNKVIYSHLCNNGSVASYSSNVATVRAIKEVYIYSSSNLVPTSVIANTDPNLLTDLVLIQNNAYSEYGAVTTASGYTPVELTIYPSDIAFATTLESNPYYDSTWSPSYLNSNPSGYTVVYLSHHPDQRLICTISDTDVDAVTDTISINGRQIADDTPIRFADIGDMTIDGQSDIEFNVYYVVSSTAETIQVSDSIGGAALELTAPTTVDELKIIYSPSAFDTRSVVVNDNAPPNILLNYFEYGNRIAFGISNLNAIEMSKQYSYSDPGAIAYDFDTGNRFDSTYINTSGSPTNPNYIRIPNASFSVGDTVAVDTNGVLPVELQKLYISQIDQISKTGSVVTVVVPTLPSYVVAGYNVVVGNTNNYDEIAVVTSVNYGLNTITYTTVKADSPAIESDGTIRFGDSYEVSVRNGDYYRFKSVLTGADVTFATVGNGVHIVSKIYDIDTLGYSIFPDISAPTLAEIDFDDVATTYVAHYSYNDEVDAEITTLLYRYITVVDYGNPYLKFIRTYFPDQTHTLSSPTTLKYYENEAYAHTVDVYSSDDDRIDVGIRYDGVSPQWSESQLAINTYNLSYVAYDEIYSYGIQQTRETDFNVPMTVKSRLSTTLLTDSTEYYAGDTYINWSVSVPISTTGGYSPYNRYTIYPSDVYRTPIDIKYIRSQSGILTIYTEYPSNASIGDSFSISGTVNYDGDYQIASIDDMYITAELSTAYPYETYVGQLKIFNQYYDPQWDSSTLYEGDYTVIHEVFDSNYDSTYVLREVSVNANVAPVITLSGDVFLKNIVPYNESAYGYTATDNNGAVDITDDVVIVYPDEQYYPSTHPNAGIVNPYYDVSWDASAVVPGAKQNNTYVSQGITYYKYRILYYVLDALGEYAEAVRTVYISAESKYSITLNNGSINTFSIHVPTDYVEYGATVVSNYDGSTINNILIEVYDSDDLTVVLESYNQKDIILGTFVASTLDPLVINEYVIRYNVIDANGTNQYKDRRVIYNNGPKPVITLL